MVLGNKIKSKISGLEGIAIAKSSSLSGSVQFCIKRMVLNEKSEELKSSWVDIQELVFSDKGITEEHQIEHQKINFNLGDTVTHFNGFTGVAIEVIKYLNGCTSIGVMSKTSDGNKMPEIEYISLQYLTKIDETKVEVNSVPLGGPSTNAPTM
jgi:hypothetical protein